MAIKAIGYGQQQPYVGPRAFSKEDAPLFFGRDREAAELLSLILAHPVVLLYAPSGAGKTSLLQAKIITLLKERDDLVLGSVRVGGETSTASEIRNVFVFNALTSLQGEIRATTELVDQTLQEYLEGQSAPDTAEDFSQRRVIIFDQFEEIFTSYPERWLDRKGFFDEINEALADPLLRIVFAMREEYIASLDPYADRLPGRLSTRLRLEPLRKKAALLAVAGPLAGTGRSFTLAASEKLVDNLLHVSVKSEDGMSVASGEFVEPLQLQIVCQRLWRSLPKELETIDEDYIRDYGDVDEALANYYEGCIGEVVQTSGADESLLRSWFDSALITPGGTRGLVYRDRKTTRKLPNEWVDLLEKLYLVRAEMRGGARWYELIHDRFINPIRSSNSIWKKQRLRKSLSDQEVEEYVRFKAFKNGEARRLSAKLGRPERLWHKLLEEPGASEEGVLQDWQSAELIFALDVLEGGVHLSGRIGRRSLRQLEKEWFAEAKRTKAYL
ncbi:MAG TPA: hypothetical protein VLV54_20130, partial [Thermoanaerobaculia bacterium]|nr:hypothetical protein [Thermoanaerobaculia bacterium]